MDVKGLLEKNGGKVFSIDSTRTVEDAIREMSNNKVSAIIVTEGDKTVGIFTERDVVRCYTNSNGKDFSEIMIQDGMTKDVIYAEPDEDMSTIMSVMVEKNIRHLPVIEKAVVVGMLSIRDIVQTQVKKLNSEIHYLTDYITAA